VLAVAAPPPAKLRTIGWTLIGTSASAAVLLIIGLAR